MDKYQYVTGESKAFHSVCYIKGCNKVATTAVRLIISKKLDLVINVCNACLPKVSGDILVRTRDKSKTSDKKSFTKV